MIDILGFHEVHGVGVLHGHRRWACSLLGFRYRNLHPLQQVVLTRQNKPRKSNVHSYIAQRFNTLPPVVDLLIPTPTQILWEAVSHSKTSLVPNICTKPQYDKPIRSHNISTNITKHSFIQLTELRQRGERKILCVRVPNHTGTFQLSANSDKL